MFALQVCDCSGGVQILGVKASVAPSGSFAMQLCMQAKYCQELALALNRGARDDDALKYEVSHCNLRTALGGTSCWADLGFCLIAGGLGFHGATYTITVNSGHTSRHQESDSHKNPLWMQ